MKWRVIPLQTHDAYFNMAADEAIARSVKAGGDPTIRFYRWNPSAVSIGCFQSMDVEVNVDECNKRNIDYVRRKTGAGAVYHDTNAEITYSVISQEDILPKGIIESYKLICGWIILGLKNLGITAEFAPINDVVVSGRKLSGNAQTRREGVVIQHGTVLYDLDIDTMFKVLKVSSEKISDKMIKSVDERVGRVVEYKKVTIEELYDALLKGFTEGKEYYMGNMTDEEIKRAEYLAESTYKTKQWNFSR